MVSGLGWAETEGPRGLPDILKGMKIFSLVSGCRIAWQEQGTEHRVTVGEGGGQGRGREGGRKGEPPQDDSDDQ